MSDTCNSTMTWHVFICRYNELSNLKKMKYFHERWRGYVTHVRRLAHERHTKLHRDGLNATQRRDTFLSVDTTNCPNRREWNIFTMGGEDAQHVFDGRHVSGAYFTVMGWMQLNNDVTLFYPSIQRIVQIEENGIYSRQVEQMRNTCSMVDTWASH